MLIPIIGVLLGYAIAAVVIKVWTHRSLNKERTELGLQTKPLNLRRVRT